MKKKFVGIGLSTIMFLLMVSIGCKGNTGPADPAGPAGDKGAEGTPAVDKGSISGTVKDALNNPVDGATVETSPTTSTATTDTTGAFTISDVPIGVYTVTPTKSGYVVFSLSGVGVAAGGTTLVSLVLTPESPWVREQSPGV